MRWLRNNEIPSQLSLWNRIKNASVDKFFFRTIFFCPAYIFFIPRRSPPPATSRIYCCDDTIIVYCRHRRAGRRMLWVSYYWALNCWVLSVDYLTADADCRVPKCRLPDCRRLSVCEIRIQKSNDNKRFCRPKCARSCW